MVQLMNKITVTLLNPESINDAAKMAGFCARLTQRGHQIKDSDTMYKLYQKSVSKDLIKNLTELPHPTLQKFGTINICVTGASRRFLAQITRHQNEVKFMSASLQYSDYSDNGDFVVPYNILGTSMEKKFIADCQAMMREYKNFTEKYDNDSAGYLAPQSLRNVLVISATPYQWKHMIRQRICRRNTDETRYVMLKCWEIISINDKYGLFDDCFPYCCKEGKFSCKNPFDKSSNPTDIIKKDFPKIYGSEVLINE